MAEQQGGAGVLGACGAGHWARGEAVFLCPPLLRNCQFPHFAWSHERLGAGGSLPAD